LLGEARLLDFTGFTIEKIMGANAAMVLAENNLTLRQALIYRQTTALITQK